MKKLLVISFFFFAFLAKGQSGFPVSATSVSAQAGYADLHSMFVAEGRRNGWNTSVKSTTAIGTVLAATPASGSIPGSIKYSVSLSLAFTTTPLGKACEIQGGSISCSKAATGTFFLNNNANASYPAFGYESSAWSCPASGFYSLPGGGVIRFGAQLLNASIGTITDVNSATTTPVISSTAVLEFGYSASLSWIETTDDLNYAAPYVIEVIGDSKLHNTGPTGMNTMFVYYLRNYYLAKGQNVRIRNHAVAGSTSAQHEYALTSGRYTEPVKAQLIIQDLTTNDVGTGINADSTGKRNARIATYLSLVNPSAKVLVFSGTPRNDNSTFQTNAATTNTSVQTAITNLANPNILFISSISSAWSPTATVNYIADGLHPSDTGNLAWWGVVKSFLDANVPSLPKPLPR